MRVTTDTMRKDNDHLLAGAWWVILNPLDLIVCLFSAKKMKDTLSSFLVNMPGIIDTPGSQDNSTLQGIVDKPPGKSFYPHKKIISVDISIKSIVNWVFRITQGDSCIY